MLGGDWNVVPEDRDVFSVRATAQRRADAAGSRAGCGAGLLHQGWTDALRALHPNEEKLYTFWDYTAGCWQRDAGFRIDHLLCSPEAADRLHGAGVDKMGAGRGKGQRPRADLGGAELGREPKCLLWVSGHWRRLQKRCPIDR